MKIISKGAEATLYKTDFEGKEALSKVRHKKSYRIPEIDEKIRKERTVREARYIKKMSGAIKCPKVFRVEEDTIVMQYLQGTIAKNYDLTKIAESIGKQVAQMHELDFIHNDLTTSNIIVVEKEPYFIDFGLSFFSKRIEDRAMDLVVFKKILLASHADVFDKVWKLFLKGYEKYKLYSDVIMRTKEIEKRWRYSNKD